MKAMEAIVEVTATESTRAILQEAGPLKHVRFVTKRSPDQAVRHLVVVRVSDFEEPIEEFERLIASGDSFISPLVLMALTKERQSVAALQRLALVASRLGAKKSDPFVSPTVDVARRILKAYSLGAEKHLIASAAIENGMLSVWSCEPRLYRCAVSDVPALAGLSGKALGKFTVSASGSRLHWDGADVDLDMDTIREFADPKARRITEAKYRTDAVRYGAAIRRVRLARHLLQGSIAGLSEREVRRLEKGEVLPHSDTLKKLADAHGWSVPEYMAKIAKESKATASRPR